MNSRKISLLLVLFLCFGYTLAAETTDLTPGQQVALQDQLKQLNRYKEMQRQLAREKREISQQASDDAYQTAVRERLALTPKQVRRLKAINWEKKKAENAPLFDPKQIVKTEKWYIHASDIKDIHLSPDFFVTISFFDNTGAPWPIAKGGVNLASNTFQYKVMGKDQNQLILWVKGEDAYTRSNGIISLAGVNTPLIFNLIANDAVSDSKLTFIIPETGPEANTVNALSPAAVNAEEDDVLLQFLTGIAPPTAIRLKVIGMDAEAWKYKGKTYIRTDSQLRSPPWLASRAAGSIHVYKLGDISELLFTKNGASEMVSLEANDDGNDNNG